MSVQTVTRAEMKSSTVEDATQALKRVRQSYDRMGYGEIVEKRLLDLLTQETILREGRSSKAAERFRNTLWDTFSGGGVSAAVTREVFESLGRGDEADPYWD